MQREITKANVREVVRRGSRTPEAITRSSRDCSTWRLRTKAVPELPPQARLSASVQRVPLSAGSAFATPLRPKRLSGGHATGAGDVRFFTSCFTHHRPGIWRLRRLLRRFRWPATAPANRRRPRPVRRASSMCGALSGWPGSRRHHPHRARQLSIRDRRGRQPHAPSQRHVFC